jgi:hypothetical protein
VWAWGTDANGQIAPTPAAVEGLDGITSIDAGTSHSLAVRGSDGSVWAWGTNSAGQLGNGTTEAEYRPVAVEGVIGAKAVSAGDGFSLAQGSQGIWGWGANSSGQLGNGTTEDRSTPGLVRCLPTSPTAEDASTARCIPVRRGSGVALAGTAVAGVRSSPASTATITCAVETPTTTYSASQTLSGGIAALAANFPIPPSGLIVCTSARFTYMDGYIAAVARTCEEIA